MIRVIHNWSQLQQGRNHSTEYYVELRARPSTSGGRTVSTARRVRSYQHKYPPPMSEDLTEYNIVNTIYGTTFRSNICYGNTTCCDKRFISFSVDIMDFSCKRVYYVLGIDMKVYNKFDQRDKYYYSIQSVYYHYMVNNIFDNHYSIYSKYKLYNNIYNIYNKKHSLNNFVKIIPRIFPYLECKLTVLNNTIIYDKLIYGYHRLSLFNIKYMLQHIDIANYDKDVL